MDIYIYIYIYIYSCALAQFSGCISLLVGALFKKFSLFLNTPYIYVYSSTPYPRIVRSENYRGCLKPRIIPKDIYNVIFV
jgi:hypothetical protein